jgi:uncharacterized protein YidB (DUF937 family)
MSDALSRMLANALGGLGGDQGGGQGRGSPLGEPRMPGAAPQGGAPDLGGLLGGLLGGQGGAGGMGGGLGGLLGGLLGGMGGAPSRAAPGGGMGGGVTGAALMALLAYLMQGRGGTAGLSSLTDRLRGAGLGDQVDSWVGPGSNRDLRPEELARAFPPEALDQVERATGLGRDDVLSQLSRGLPGMVDRLTPQGRMPDRDEDLDGVDEKELLGNFSIVPGAAYGKHAPGDGGRKG